jgi:molecular chaperone GrpE
MVHESLINALKDNGLEVIKTEGEAFDPNMFTLTIDGLNTLSFSLYPFCSS